MHSKIPHSKLSPFVEYHVKGALKPVEINVSLNENGVSWSTKIDWDLNQIFFTRFNKNWSTIPVHKVARDMINSLYNSYLKTMLFNFKYRKNGRGNGF